jgi:hypothetical protein
MKAITPSQTRHAKAWEIFSRSRPQSAKASQVFAGTLAIPEGVLIVEDVGRSFDPSRTRVKVGKSSGSQSNERTRVSLVTETIGKESDPRKEYWQRREARAIKQRQASKHTCADDNMQRAETIIAFEKHVYDNRPKLRVKPKRRARTRRTSCVGGDLYREQFRQGGMTKKRDKRRGQVIGLLQSRVLGDDPEEIFRLWDTDGDGTLSRHEMKSGLDRVGLNLLKSDIDVLYDSIGE